MTAFCGLELEVFDLVVLGVFGALEVCFVCLKIEYLILLTD